MNEQKTENQIYVLGDGDRIRERIEKHLLNNELELCTKLSHDLIKAINTIKNVAISRMRADIIIAGGDDIILRVEAKRYQKEHIYELRSIFNEISGSSISFGIGNSVTDAYVNLRRAKSSSTEKIIDGD